MGWFCLVDFFFFFKVQESSLKDTHLHREFKPHRVPVSSHQGAPQMEKDPIPPKSLWQRGQTLTKEHNPPAG